MTNGKYKKKQDIDPFVLQTYNLCHAFLSTATAYVASNVAQGNVDLAPEEKKLQDSVLNLCRAWETNAATEHHGGRIVCIADLVADSWVQDDLAGVLVAMRHLIPTMQDERTIRTLEASGAHGFARLCRQTSLVSAKPVLH